MDGMNGTGWNIPDVPAAQDPRNNGGGQPQPPQQGQTTQEPAGGQSDYIRMMQQRMREQQAQTSQPVQLTPTQAQVPTQQAMQAQAPIPTFPSQPVQTQQPQAQPMTRQQMIREQQMRGTMPNASSGRQVLQQGSTYNPQPAQQQVGSINQQVQQMQQARPVQQPTQQAPIPSFPQQPVDTQPAQEDQTGADKPKMKFTKNSVFIIVAIVLAFLLLAYFLSGGNGETGEDPNSQQSSEFYDPFEDPNVEWITPDKTFNYTMEEREKLRLAGYTGDEIEQFEARNADVDQIYNEAVAKRDAWVQQAIAPLYDTASDEYKSFISQTWLTLPQRTDMALWENCSYYRDRKNLDYEKVDVYGNQLFIKIYLDDSDHDDWFFLNVTPEDWNKLQSRGNVIVEYTYCYRLEGEGFGGTAIKDKIYITDAKLEIIR